MVGGFLDGGISAQRRVRYAAHPTDFLEEFRVERDYIGLYRESGKEHGNCNIIWGSGFRA